MLAKFEDIDVWKVKSVINPAEDDGDVLAFEYPYISNIVVFVDVLPKAGLLSQASLSGSAFSSAIITWFLSSSNEGYNRLKLPLVLFQLSHKLLTKSITNKSPSVVFSLTKLIIWLKLK